MMRGRELIALKLPQMVEAQRQQREDEQISPVSPTSMGHSSNQLSQSSTVSDMSLSSPTTPSAGGRSHSRLPSSTSSLPSSPLMRESFEGFGSSKRPLTDLKEELEERDEDVEMADSGIGDQSLEREYSYNRQISEAEWALDDFPRESRYSEYDPADESDFSTAPKRQRSEASPFNGIAARIGAIKPSFSRKWKSRKASPTLSMPGPSREASLSRANSTRAPSFASVTVDPSKAHAFPLPPTPTRSALDESVEDSRPPLVDVDRANEHGDDEDNAKDQAKPTTPLLPPIMTAIPDHIKDVPYQSPLQSPTVADPIHEPTSTYNSPLATPQITSLPSPPLSTRPSIGSFRSRQPSTTQRSGLGITQSPLIPSAEIPPNPLDPVSTQDHWSNALGHANFTIDPEPYLPAAPITASSCKALRADWEAARYAYTRHLSRTGEHYGPTSKTFKLTEQKWAEIDAEWMRNIDAAVASAVPTSPIFAASLAKVEAAVTHVEAMPHPPLIKMPSLSDDKFPGLGDEGIVGPMEVVKSPLQARLEVLQQQQESEGKGLKRKRKWTGVVKWVQGVCAGIGSKSA